jgi:hypothetical protein
LVYIVGESDGRGSLCFDPASAEWSTLAPTLSYRRDSATFVLGGILYAAGGHSDISSVERYDMATDTWTAVADMLEGRSSFGAVTIESAGPVEEQDLFDSLIAEASNLYQ